MDEGGRGGESGGGEYKTIVAKEEESWNLNPVYAGIIFPPPMRTWASNLTCSAFIS